MRDRERHYSDSRNLLEKKISKALESKFARGRTIEAQSKVDHARLLRNQHSPLGVQKSRGQLASVNELIEHKSSTKELSQTFDGHRLREEMFYVTQGDDRFYKNNKILTNLSKEQHDQSPRRAFAGANNKFSASKFTNRNDALPYSETVPTYLRLNEGESKFRFPL